jgi:hypothetical protein
MKLFALIHNRYGKRLTRSQKSFLEATKVILLSNPCAKVACYVFAIHGSEEENCDLWVGQKRYPIAEIDQAIADWWDNARMYVK